MSPSSPPPSNRLAAGVPSGGNGKYIAVGLLLLAGIIGLLIKMRGGEAQVQPTPTPQPIATVPESRLDDIPPPPPLEDASVPETGAKLTTTRATDACAVKSCVGTVSDELEKALATRARQARRCYESELKNDPSLKGKIAVTVRIATTGQVCTTTVQNSDLPSITPCVERVFRGTGGLPSPRGGCVDTTVPMSFVPGR